MSTPRRTLGTGPTPSTRTTEPVTSPRLLPAERAAAEEHQEEEQAGLEPRRRRTLGPGGRG